MSDPRTLHIDRYDPDRDARPYLPRSDIDVDPPGRSLVDGRPQPPDVLLRHGRGTIAPAART